MLGGLASITHIFFDVVNGISVAFFDLPGVDPGPCAEVLGGLYHLAISVTPEHWRETCGRLDAESLSYQGNGTFDLLRGPARASLKLTSDLGPVVPIAHGVGHQAVMPPSMATVAPVMRLASSPARNRQSGTTSRASPSRPSIEAWAICSRTASLAG